MAEKKEGILTKMTLFLEKYLMPIAGKIAEQKHLGAMRDGMLMAMPLLIVGSAFLILGFIPIPGYDKFMAGIFGEQWLSKITLPVGVTFNLMAVFANIGIAYKLCEKYKVEPLLGSMISLGAFLLVSPNTIKVGEQVVGGVIPTALMGGQGLFVSMIMAMISAEIYRTLIQKNIVIKLPPSVPPTVGKSFGALIPGAVVITTAWIINLVVAMTPFENIHYVISKLLVGPVTAIGGSYFGMLTLVLLANMLWMCGLHGANIVYGVAAPMLYTLMDQNLQAFKAGQEIPNIVSQNMFDIFVSIGGSGGTLGLVILMMTRAKSAHLKELGKLSIAPGLFNINEPIIFGTPIVMNPLMLIPFLLSPAVAVTLAYFTMKMGLVAKLPGIAAPWTSPAGIGAFIASGGKISAGLLQFVIVLVQIVIWYPFFKIMDKQKYDEEQGFKG
ncbi:MAG: PTS cellobiose transporter subunit IIC [Fusobacteriaceae bacterium]|nr:PTS cellobiose transporter subunit IIC [Fusobacteriaceae bacterium]